MPRNINVRSCRPRYQNSVLYSIIVIIMSKNEEILRFAVANQALEGFIVTDEEKAILMDCLEGRRSFKDAVQDVISRYAVEGAS